MYFIFGRDYYSPLVKKLSTEVEVLSFEKIDEYLPRTFSPEKIYTVHEEVVEALKLHLAPGSIKDGINIFRDKWNMRVKFQPLFPNYYFTKVDLLQIAHLSLPFNDPNKKYVIKPIKGFFSIAVKVIDQKTDMKKLQAEIVGEMSEQHEIHPYYFNNNSLSDHEFVVEEMFGGQVGDLLTLDNAEIVIDGFYDSQGKFVLLCIYHHPLSKHREFFHLLYYTNKQLFELFAKKAEDFFSILPGLVGIDLKSFPLHAEFRYVNGVLFPIEINPLRFGGMGLADTLYHAMGENPYLFFFEDRPFDWKKAWGDCTDSVAWVLGYKGEKVKAGNLMPDHNAFANRLRAEIIEYHPIDDHDVFAIAYIKVKHASEFQPILDIYFE